MNILNFNVVYIASVLIGILLLIYLLTRGIFAKKGGASIPILVKVISVPILVVILGVIVWVAILLAPAVYFFSSVGGLNLLFFGFWGGVILTALIFVSLIILVVKS